MIRVLVVAAAPAVRAGLRALLEGGSDISVVGEVTPTRLLGGATPPADVLVIDLAGDAETLLDALDDVLATLPVVLLTADPGDALPRLRAEASPRAWLLDEAGAEELAAAVVAVARGLVVLDPAVARAALSRAAAPLRAVAGDEHLEALTEREGEVLRLLALGLPNKGIALRLGISEHTVKFHVGAILAKLGAAGRTEAVMLAARRGLLPL